jgi:DNA-binding beta-propeller fold protein YncE
MTDLHDLKTDIDNMHFSTPSVGDIIDRARRHRRRIRRRVTGSTGLLVFAIVAALVAISTSGKGPGSFRAASGPFRGTSAAAFISRDGLLYVADQGNNSLLVLNPVGNRAFAPVFSIPLSFTPGVVAVAPDGSMAYVAPLVPEFEGGSNALYEVNLATERVVRTIVDHSQPLGSVTIAPNGRTGYAWNNDIVPIDLPSGHVRAPIAYSSGEYTDFEISGDGQRAFATTAGPTPNYQEIDLATGKIIRTVSTADLTLHGTSGRWTPEAVTFSRAGTSALVTLQNETGDRSIAGLLTVSTRTGRIESSVELGPGGVGNVVVAPSGERAFVLVQTPGGGYSGTFTVVPVDLSTNEALARIIVDQTQGLGLMQLTTRSTTFAVDTQWKVTAIDETTDRIRSVSTIPIPSLRGPSRQPIAFGG